VLEVVSDLDDEVQVPNEQLWDKVTMASVSSAGYNNARTNSRIVEQAECQSNSSKRLGGHGAGFVAHRVDQLHAAGVDTMQLDHDVGANGQDTSDRLSIPCLCVILNDPNG